jgi:hypothetical protein
MACTPPTGGGATTAAFIFLLRGCLNARRAATRPKNPETLRGGRSAPHLWGASRCHNETAPYTGNFSPLR